MSLWMGPIMLQNVRVGYNRQSVCCRPMLPEHFTDGYGRAEVRGRGCFQSSTV